MPSTETQDSKTVLIIDDDADVRNLVRAGLESRGTQVLEAANGQEGYALALRSKPDLVLLDILMPVMDGLTTCQRLRQKSTLPILFLSTRDEERDIIEGLGLGADGYLTKPFRIGELVAHVEATLRRTGQYQRPASTEKVFSIGDIVVNFTNMRATKGGRELPLTPTEFRILNYFNEHPGEVVSRDQLLEEIWGESPEGILTRTVDTHIARLRKKIEPYPDQPQYIQTVSGVGYRMILEEDE
ncbi:MAG: response regulator transcription factor [Armatimonadetes bacterium]|nr:response regulator transcription factor [Armatimonadota bacterium]